jgi:PAS domain S-box-containing protein
MNDNAFQETDPHTLRAENEALRMENSALRQRVANLEQELALLQGEKLKPPRRNSLPYRALFEQMTVPVAIFDVEGWVVAINHQNELLLNTTRDQVEQTFNMFEDQEALEKGYCTAFKRALRGDVVRMPPTSYNPSRAGFPGRKTSPIVWTETTYIPFCDETGSVRYVGEVNVEITERIVVEQALRESEARYRSIITTMQEGVILHDENGHIREWNHRAREMLGQTTEKLLGHSALGSAWCAIHEDGTPFDGDNHPSLVALRTAQPCSNVVMGIYAPNGSLTWVLINAQPMFCEDKNVPCGVVSTFVDITSLKQSEQALRESEARYRAVVNDQTEMICRYNADAVLTFVNEAYCRHVGKQPDDLIGWSPLVLLTPEQREQATNHLASLTPDNPVSTLEYPVTRPGGEVCWQQWTNRAIFDEAGQFIDYHSVGRDITDRVHAEEALRAARDKLEQRVRERTAELEQSNQALHAEIEERLRVEVSLRESELRYRTLVEHFPNGIVLLFDHNLRYIIARGEATVSVGSLSTVEGKTFWDVVPPEMHANLEPCYRAALHGTASSFEFEANNETHHVHVLPVRGDSGEIMAGMVMTQNITERKRAATEMERRIDERTGMLQYATAQLLKELTQREQVEQMLLEAHNELEKRVEERTAELEQINRTLQEEISIRMLTEKALVEERALLSQRVAERTTELSIANAELSRALRTKDEFLANMSHELRTPLNAILGLSESLQEGTYGSLTDKQHRTVAVIEESGRHLLALINDILDLAKIEAGRSELCYGIVGIDTACHASLQFIKQQAFKRQITVRFTKEDERITTIYADERRLKQILINLLTNAVKFTPPGGEIGLSVRASPGNEVIHFVVWDTGIGIAEEHIERLFKPFVQVESGLARHHEGTGLGLALVARLTELHGGSVQVESEEGNGSQFTISLPFLKDPTAEHSASGEPARQTTQGQSVPFAQVESSPLILLAEDNESTLEVFTDYLTVKGYQVLVARSSAEVFAHLAHTLPALILMDIQMPGMDGLEMTRHIRADPETVAIPIIALTALAMPGDRERCLQAGANDYMSKPVNLKELVRAIERQLAVG